MMCLRGLWSAALAAGFFALAAGALAAVHVTNLEPAVFHSDALAVSGDTIVVGGALSDDRNVADVYVRRGGQWHHQARLVPSGDRRPFASPAVAVAGDTAILGDWTADGSDGAAYVFTRAYGYWHEQGTLSAPAGAAGTKANFPGFGFTTAVDGDTALIGTLGRDDLAYVFVRDGDHWQLQAPLVTGGQSGAGPVSLALDGDTAVLGASTRNAVYVFTRHHGTWTRQARLTPADGQAGDFFGESVDVDGDRIIVGAYGDDNPGRRSDSPYAGRDTGAAYVFVRQGTVWHQEAKLLPRDRLAGDVFGWSVAIDGHRVVVGAPNTRDEGFGDGAAYLYEQHDGRWLFRSKLASGDPNAVMFGHRVALDGDDVAISAFNFGTAPSAYLFSSQPPAFVRCVGDLDGDGVADLTVITGDGQATTRSLEGTLVNRFAFAGDSEIVDVATMPDTNGDGAAELAALDAASSSLQVRDSATGALLAAAPQSPYRTPLAAAVAGDTNGDGTPDLVTLAWRPITIQVNDGLSGAPVGHFRLASRFFDPRDLLVYPDQNGNGAPEVALLAENRTASHSDVVELRDLATGEKVRDIWFGDSCPADAVSCLPAVSSREALLHDLNGNGFPELAVLRLNPAFRAADRRATVVVRDGHTGQPLGEIPFDPGHPPERLLAVPDLNGNGADELLAFGRRAGYRDQRVVVKDSRTGQRLSALWFDRFTPMEDLALCPDLNGNGSPEVVLLGRHLDDGRLRAIVKDVASGERLATVTF